MAEERISNELIYEVLRGIQDRLVRIEDRLERIEDRLTRVETLVGDLVKADLSRNAEMTALDRRLSRVEDRLNLREADV
ncbi:MAG: hypothetical protein ACU0BF_06820 [Paracoccaceae bacterium]